MRFVFRFLRYILDSLNDGVDLVEYFCVNECDAIPREIIIERWVNQNKRKQLMTK